MLDGLTMGYLLSEVREDFWSPANDMFPKFDEISGAILPVSFNDTKNALQVNLETSKTALKYLDSGGVIGINLGDTVPKAVTPFNHSKDPRWRNFTAKMVAKLNVVALPIHFDEHTSPLFQFAGHMHATLRMGLLIKESGRRVDASLKISIGDLLCQDKMTPYLHNPRKLMDFLRQKTYLLCAEPLDAFGYDCEFEERHRA